ncbi:hypothetical protein [Sphingomonas quercus]|uniref:Uncharacterized protein n=1 Tax=Sphingomonas quercus TaxID=2842451 RepID=A0ABS6BGN2_9SPHN|nr:hypothetical protein [Sphingomonas quercus]MBU3076405.1 hypothetical protein [Sphingomonas quercus]
MLLSVMLFQAVAGPPRPEPAPRAKAQADCPAGPGAEGDIIVCAHRREGFRIGAQDVANEEKSLPKADFRLFGQSRLKISGEQKGVGGFTSNRAMATIAIPF